MSRFIIKRVLLCTLLAAALGSAAEPQQEPRTEPEAPAQRVSRRPHFRLAGFSVGAGYTHGRYWSPYYYGPGYGGFYPGYFPYYGYVPALYGLYDPIWYSPMIHPGLYNGFSQQPRMGEVKLDTKSKLASVYVDGAFAGTADKRKHMWLEPGAYNLELREGNSAYRQRVYVLSGQTLDVRAELSPEKEPKQ